MYTRVCIYIYIHIVKREREREMYVYHNHPFHLIRRRAGLRQTRFNEMFYVNFAEDSSNTMN